MFDELPLQHRAFVVDFFYVVSVAKNVRPKDEERFGSVLKRYGGESGLVAKFKKFESEVDMAALAKRCDDKQLSDADRRIIDEMEKVPKQTGPVRF